MHALHEPAAVVGSRIQSALASCSIPIGSTKITLQVSVGIAAVETADNAETFIVRAQEAVGVKQKLVTVG